MRKLTIILISFALISACSGTNGYQEKNVELINNYVHAVETLDFEAMSNYLDDEYLGLGPSINDSTTKSQAIESWKYNVSNLYESIKYNRSRTIAVSVPDGPEKGDWVSNWAELTINYKGNAGSITIWANSTYKIENNLIVRSYTFYNEADALRQMGYLFTNSNEQ